MRYIGLDLASCSGWALLEDDVLLERGTIQLISQMDLPQKLHYFHLELRSLLTRLQPEWIFIEDVILGISGAKTLAYLARLNGVAIATSFEFLQERVKLYSPPYWKSHSFEGLGGMAKKWQIQLAAVEHYNLPITGDFSDISKVIISKDLIKNQIKSESDTLRIEINKLKSKLNSKRTLLINDDRIDLNNEIKAKAIKINDNKKLLKDNEKKLDKTFAKISIDIAAQTGMTENICDACGVALCGYKETINESV